MKIFSHRLKNLKQGLEKLNEKVAFLLALAFVVIGPFFLSRVTLQWSQIHLHLIAHAFVLLVFFILLLFWALMITGERGERLFTALHGNGIRWPVLFSIALLLFSIPCFASLTSILSDFGYVSFEPQIPRGSLAEIQDFYLWHFLDSVPGLKIPEILLWDIPFKHKDRLSGWLLLAFKLSVILPVIWSFSVWRDVRKEQKKVAKEKSNK